MKDDEKLASAELARRLFCYDPETGAVTRRETCDGVLAGAVVGSVDKSGHLVVTIRGRGYMLHRVIWLLVTGEWPQDQIDHINGAPADNRWANLRPCTRTQNAQNRKTHKNNKCGFKGVWFDAQYGKWRAAIKANKAVRTLGRFDTAEEASASYRAAAAELHGEFVRAA